MYGKQDKKLSFTTLVGSQNRHHEIGLHVIYVTPCDFYDANRPPVDLYMISTKSIWKSQVG